jgi:hypothetical protein
VVVFGQTPSIFGGWALEWHRRGLFIGHYLCYCNCFANRGTHVLLTAHVQADGCRTCMIAKSSEAELWLAVTCQELYGVLCSLLLQVSEAPDVNVSKCDGLDVTLNF